MAGTVTANPLLPQEFSLRHLCHDLSATLRRSSEQLVDLTMHYSGHRESTYVMVNLHRDVAKHLPEACRPWSTFRFIQHCRTLKHPGKINRSNGRAGDKLVANLTGPFGFVQVDAQCQSNFNQDIPSGTQIHIRH